MPVTGTAWCKYVFASWARNSTSWLGGRACLQSSTACLKICNYTITVKYVCDTYTYQTGLNSAYDDPSINAFFFFKVKLQCTLRKLEQVMVSFFPVTMLSSHTLYGKQCVMPGYANLHNYILHNDFYAWSFVFSYSYVGLQVLSHNKLHSPLVPSPQSVVNLRWIIHVLWWIITIRFLRSYMNNKATNEWLV